MDTIHSAVFYGLGAVALVAALVGAFARSRSTGLLALALLALATGLLVADLSAGFAALLVFLLLGGAALATAAIPDEAAAAPRRRERQLGALAAVLVFGALAYAAYRGLFHSARYPGGQVDAAALARHLLAHDPLALLATGGAVLIGTGFGAVSALRGRA